MSEPSAMSAKPPAASRQPKRSKGARTRMGKAWGLFCMGRLNEAFCDKEDATYLAGEVNKPPTDKAYHLTVKPIEWRTITPRAPRARRSS